MDNKRENSFLFPYSFEVKRAQRFFSEGESNEEKQQEKYGEEKKMNQFHTQRELSKVLIFLSIKLV